METVPIIIYAKENKIKALSVNDSLRLDAQLKSNGWEQTKAIDATRWIERLCNDLFCNHDFVTKFGETECQECGISESEVINSNYLKDFFESFKKKDYEK